MKNNIFNTLTQRPMRLKILFICLFFVVGATSRQIFAQCSPDIIPPTVVCRALVTHDVAAGSVTVTASEFDNGTVDNCTPAALLNYYIEKDAPSATHPTTTSLNFPGSQQGLHNIVLWAVDTAGNAAHCMSTIQINQCSNNSVFCNSDIDVHLNADHTGTLVPLDGLLGSYCDFYTFQVQLDAAPFAASIALNASNIGTHTYAAKIVQTGNTCYGLVHILDYLPEHVISGAVFIDVDADCQQQLAQETGLEGWTVRATGSSGQVLTATTDAQGHYQIQADNAEAQYEVVLDAPFNYGGNCGTTFTVQFPAPTIGDTAVVNIPVALDPVCPLLFVDLATPKIRPCFSGTYYVQYSNASIFPIFGTHIDVTLDPALSLLSSSLPATLLADHQYRFETGTLNPGLSGQFTILYATDCAAPVGATHCSTAHIFPDTLCPNGSGWSGANIEVKGQCQHDSIFLNIKNTGSGANAQPLEFIVVEDVLMFGSGTFDLAPGATKALDPIVSTGATYRLQAQQEPGHPYGGMPAVAVEGCGGFTPGLATMLILNNSNPFIATDCRESVAAEDPNGKQALPKGFGTDHLIEKNTPIDYTIRFQNTGTDTAYRVVILDTLSSALSAVSVRPGAASHPFRFELLAGHILKFTFDHLILPDSSTSPEGSKGFVQFNVKQTTDNADGVLIYNKAAIYFDANPPVITNKTFHKVGSKFILVSTNTVPDDLPQLQVYPNPASDRVFFNAPGWSGGPVNFMLTDIQGKLVLQKHLAQLPMTLERGQMTAGVYLFRMADGMGRMLWSGKVEVR